MSKGRHFLGGGSPENKIMQNNSESDIVEIIDE